MSSPYLGIAHIAAAQSQKEVTANDAFDGIDAAMNAESLLALADANPAATLSQLQMAGGFVLKCTGALTAPRNVIVPAIQRTFAVLNATTGGQAITVKTASGTGITVNGSDGYVSLYCDGTNVVALSAAAAPGAGGGITFIQVPVGPTASADPFSVSHPLGRTPVGAVIQMTSPLGLIAFQMQSGSPLTGNPMYDASNVYLTCSDAGLTCMLLLW